jgi:hypothetical protein
MAVRTGRGREARGLPLATWAQPGGEAGS